MELSNRLKYGDLNEKYRNDVLASFNHFERDAMISVVNVICGNIEIECASAINLLTSNIEGKISSELNDSLKPNLNFIH